MRKTSILIILLLFSASTLLQAQWISSDSTLVAGGDYSSIGWPAGITITVPVGATVTIGANGTNAYGGGNLFVHGTLIVLSDNLQIADSLMVYPGGILNDSGSLVTAFVVADTGALITIDSNYSTNSALPGSISDHYYPNSVVTIRGTAQYNDGELILDSAATLNTHNLNMNNPNSEIRGTINNSGTLVVAARPNIMACPGNINTANLINNSEASWIDGSGYVSVSDTFNGVNPFTSSSTITMNINPANPGDGNPGLATLGTTSPCTSINLPVSLTSFYVEQAGPSVLLHWTTATETDQKGFGIQRSTDGKHWIEIGFVGSHATGGASTQLLQYSYTDSHPLAGYNYYRLMQVDIDGGVIYSPVRAVLFSASYTDISLYPNPVISVLNVSLQADKQVWRYALTDIVGNVRQRGTLLQGSNMIDVNGLARGVYLLKVTSDNDVRAYKVMVKGE